MSTKSIVINPSNLRLLIESRQDSLGKECFYVTFSHCKIAFRNITSVLDFIEMNKNLGYVEDK